MTAVKSPPALGPSSHAPAGATRRVLVIEDNPDTRNSLRVLLQMWGHEVEVAGDGLQGVCKALAWRRGVVGGRQGPVASEGHPEVNA